MGADFTQAFRDGCKDAPVMHNDRSQVEEVIAAMCTAVNAECTRLYVLPEGGPALALVAFTYREEQAQFRPTTSIPEGSGRVYLMHGTWESVRDIPAVHGVELLTYQRNPSGYPVRMTAFDGAQSLCNNREQLGAALAKMLRDPHTGGRIRRAAKDFIARRSTQ